MSQIQAFLMSSGDPTDNILSDQDIIDIAGHIVGSLAAKPVAVPYSVALAYARDIRQRIRIVSHILLSARDRIEGPVTALTLDHEISDKEAQAIGLIATGKITIHIVEGE